MTMMELERQRYREGMERGMERGMAHAKEKYREGMEQGEINKGKTIVASLRSKGMEEMEIREILANSDYSDEKIDIILGN